MARYIGPVCRLCRREGMKLYFKGPNVKVVVALGRGKKDHDRREDIKKRDAEREMARAGRRR